MLRAPLLPVETYLALEDPSSPWTARWQTSQGTLLPHDPWVNLALIVGSGNLVDALRKGPGQNQSAQGKLLRYQIRMSTRPTPYALFAGAALCEFGRTTNCRLEPTSAFFRARPDMGWLLSFVDSLESRPELFCKLQMIAHAAAFEVAGRIFLNDPTPLKEQPYAPTSIRATGAVRTALSRARSYIPYDDLVKDLCRIKGGETSKAEHLIAELWKQGLLLTNLRPSLTASDPATHVVRQLLSITTSHAEAIQVQAMLEGLANWAKLEPAVAANMWSALEARMRILHSSIDVPLEVDLALSMSSAVITNQVAQEAARAADLLLRLTTLPHGMPHLNGYRAAFESRYGHDREVPLLELLDPNYGLGPPSTHGLNSVDPQRLAVRNETLHTIALNATKDRCLAVEIDDDALARLTTWDISAESLPLSLDICVFLIASSAAAIDAGEFLVAIGPNVGGGQAGRYLGRFGDLLGSRVNHALTEVAHSEALHAPEATWTELVYLPRRLRSANVVVRQSVLNHEIDIGVSPGVPLDHTISLDELSVSVRKGRFRLRWSGTNADIIVRAGHMLNTLQAPTVCRFLSDIAEDGVAQFLGFDWGPTATYPFLPRLQNRRVILSPARWRISAAFRNAELPVDESGFQRHLSDFRERWNVPRYVYLVEGDNRLLLDLEAPKQADELRKEVAKIRDLGTVILQEALPGPEHAWLEGTDGHYIAELVVPLVRRPRTDDSRILTEQLEIAEHPVLPAPIVSPFTRSRPPGSDWLFLKIYCPVAFQDELLVTSVREFCQETSRAGMLNGWFYIRYTDPDPHIRIRFRGDPEWLLRRLFPDVCSWCADLIADGLCQRFSFDTYEREIERYGGLEGMAVGEAIFTSDSPAAVDILALLRTTPELDRLTALIVSVDDLLSGLGLDEIQRLDWYANRVSSRKAAGDEFRQRKNVLRFILGSINGIKSLPGSDVFARVLGQRRSSLKVVADTFLELHEGRTLNKSRNSILESIVHMHCNRLAGNDVSIEERALSLLLRIRRSLKEAPLIVANP
jgi:lantibiotic biosynthesis protein